MRRPLHGHRAWIFGLLLCTTLRASVGANEWGDFDRFKDKLGKLIDQGWQGTYFDVVRPNNVLLPETKHIHESIMACAHRWKPSPSPSATNFCDNDGICIFLKPGTTDILEWYQFTRFIDWSSANPNEDVFRIACVCANRLNGVEFTGSVCEQRVPCPYAINWITHEGTYYNGIGVIDYDVESIHHCRSLCEFDRQCRSFVYNYTYKYDHAVRDDVIAMRRCYALKTVLSESDGDEWGNAPMSIYGEKLLSDLCKNGGTCMKDIVEPWYRCSCTQQYGGQDCSVLLS